MIENITKFLLELGQGFAFVGRQYPIQIGNREREMDLLFYHLELRCYVVIELKVKKFEPDYTGKLGYYILAVDEQLKKILIIDIILEYYLPFTLSNNLSTTSNGEFLLSNSGTISFIFFTVRISSYS